MPGGLRIMCLILFTLISCAPPARERTRAVLDPEHAAALTDSVRAFAGTVARGVTAQGPAAWRSYFADDPAFFMVAEGRLVFPSSAAATRGIEGLTRTITQIELRWGDSLRVDGIAPGVAVVAMPYHETRRDARGHQVVEDGYFTGIVEHRTAGWQLRDAHWSVLSQPSPVP